MTDAVFTSKKKQINREIVDFGDGTQQAAHDHRFPIAND